jgi:ABC-type sulfate/molybdate transport systems ATPase subunit
MHTSLRADLLKMLKEVIEKRNITVVYVSHSWDEISHLCQNVAVLVDGRIEQADSVPLVYRRPTTPAVAKLTGPVVEIPMHLMQEGLVGCQSSDNDWLAVSDAEGGPMLVRPQQLRLTAAPNGLPWRVEQCRPDQTGWLATLVNRNERLDVPSPAPVERQFTVRIEIMCGTGGSLPNLAAYGTTESP